MRRTQLRKPSPPSEFFIQPVPSFECRPLCIYDFVNLMIRKTINLILRPKPFFLHILLIHSILCVEETLPLNQENRPVQAET